MILQPVITRVTFAITLLFATLLSTSGHTQGKAVTNTTVSAVTYHVDAAGGDDRNDGSAAHPWATLAKARRQVIGDAKVVVHGGHYGVFSEHRPATGGGTLHFVAAGETRPQLTGISLTYADLQPAGLIFEGFDIYSDDSRRLVLLEKVRGFELKNSEIHAARWTLDRRTGVDAVVVRKSSDINIEHNLIHEVFRGIQVGGSTRVSLRNNFITVKGGTAIQYIGGNRDGLIEANHLTGATYTRFPEDPLAIDRPHQSMISIRSNDLVVRANLMHGLGNSSGIMLYAPDAAGGEEAYRNILFEGNALYDTSNRNAIRIYNLGDNIVFRNNLFFSHKRSGPCAGGSNDARYRYNQALIVHNVAKGYDGSGLKLFNNIFLGATLLPEKVQEAGNVFWSLRVGKEWRARSPGRSKVWVSGYLGCGRQPRDMENGTFFNSADALDFPHNRIVDFTLAEKAARFVTARDTTDEPSSLLGCLEEDGFLRPRLPQQGEVSVLGPYPTAYVRDSTGPVPAVHTGEKGGRGVFCSAR